MGSLKKLWGYYPAGEEWKKVKVDSEGKLVIPAISTGGWYSAKETWALGLDPISALIIVIFGDVRNKYSPGMKFKLTQDTTVKYFFVTKLEYHVGYTWIWVYGGTDYTLGDEDIIDNYYSFVKAPYGFPLDPNKWTVETKDTNFRLQSSPPKSTWINLGAISINIPIGAWFVDYRVIAFSHMPISSSIQIRVTLSTGNNNQSDNEFTSVLEFDNIKSGSLIGIKSKILNLSAMVTYYLNMYVYAPFTTISQIRFYGNISPTIIRARCAYL